MTLDPRRNIQIVETHEAPQIVWPKGPLRKIAAFTPIVDETVGEIVVVTLEVCGHEAHLLSSASEDSLVRCAQCFYKKRDELSSFQTVNDHG